MFWVPEWQGGIMDNVYVWKIFPTTVNQWSLLTCLTHLSMSGWCHLSCSCKKHVIIHGRINYLHSVVMASCHLFHCDHSFQQDTQNNAKRLSNTLIIYQHFQYRLIDWLIDCCLTSSEQFFSYIQDENI